MIFDNILQLGKFAIGVADGFIYAIQNIETQSNIRYLNLHKVYSVQLKHSWISFSNKTFEQSHKYGI